MSVIHRKRQPSLGRACMVALGIAVLIGCSEPPEPAKVVRPVKSMVLGSAAPAVRRNYPGSVQASQRAVLAFRVSGPLIELPIQEGQKIKEGDLLAKIDPRDFQTTLADATASLKEAEATLQAMTTARPEDIEVLAARLAADEATLKERAENLRRTQTLFKDRIITQSELDRAVAANDVAVAKVEAARKNLDKAKAGSRKEDIQAQQARIEGLESQVKTAQHAHDDTSLTAPFDGVVAQKLVENFEKVEAKQAILLFQDLENIEIVINLPENVVATARAETEADGEIKIKMAAVFDALADTEFPITLKEFSTEADPGTQTYKTTLAMPRPDPKDINVFSGMTCNVVHYESLVPGEQGSVFTIPVTAVYDEGGKRFVWVIDTNSETGTKTVGKQEIQVGDMTGGNIRVLGGLKEGQTIAISGVHFLQPGMEVSTLGSEIGDQLK